MLFIFDMGGVVTTTFGSDNPMYKKLQLCKDDFMSICSHTSPDIFNLLQLGKISVSDFWDQFNKRIGIIQRDLIDGTIDINKEQVLSDSFDVQKIPNVDNDYFRLFFHPVLNTETVELIKDLRKKHRVVCGTNTIQSHWENHLERGDYSYFDQTYASNKISEVKPNKRFWEIIMEAEGYSPEETFFTDDREDNCNAAKEIGINVQQFTTASNLRKAWEKYL